MTSYQKHHDVKKLENIKYIISTLQKLYII